MPTERKTEMSAIESRAMGVADVRGASRSAVAAGEGAGPPT